MVTDTPQKEAFIQALNLKDSVEEVFQKKLVQAIFNLPFFFSPYHDNKNEKPAEDYVFNYPDVMLKLERAGVIPPSLGCSIRTFSSSFRATDGKRGGVILRDECGKVDDKGGFEDIEVQWNNVFKRNLQVGKKLVGFGFFGSTVGDMGGGGGEAFKRLADQSHFRNTSDNGTTSSELVNVFFPSYDGMKGFIDKHGFSVIDDPTTPVMGQDGELIFQGAKSYQQNIRNSFLKDGNMNGLINETREMPFTWKEAWTLSASSSGLPEKDMMERVGDLTFAKEKTYKHYRLDWTDGLLSDVEMVEDENGDWIISNSFIKHNPSSMLNQKQWDYYGDCWMPSLSVCNRCYEGVDPFAYHDKNTTGKGKKSKGAIAVFWKFDKSIDGDKDFDNRVTEDFVALFDKRLGDKKLFAEEAAKAAILWGCHTNIESEVQATIETFQEWKLDGYMLHHFATDGSMKKVPGVKSQSNKQVMITDMDTFFNRNSKRIQLPQVLECWLKFTGPASLTDHDLCAATGWAVNGIKNPVPEELVEDAGREYFIGIENFDD
jgi:hypothetical protein